MTDPRTPTRTTSDDVYAGPRAAFDEVANLMRPENNIGGGRLGVIELDMAIRAAVDAARAPLLAELADVRLQCDLAEAFNVEIVDALPRCRSCDATGYRTHDDSCIGHPCGNCNGRGVVIVDPDAARADERNHILTWLRGLETEEADWFADMIEGAEIG